MFLAMVEAVGMEEVGWDRGSECGGMSGWNVGMAWWTGAVDGIGDSNVGFFLFSLEALGVDWGFVWALMLVRD